MVTTWLPRSLGSVAQAQRTLTRVNHRLKNQDADVCLQAFRKRLLPFFQFIYFSPEVDVQYLLVNQPVLMRAIMTVATPSTKQKLARGAKLKRILTQAMILETQSNIFALGFAGFHGVE